MKTIAYITYILTIISTFTYAGKDMRIYLSDPAEIDFLIEDLQKLKATPKLLRSFQQFFRENAEAWIEQFQYKEAGPQLLLQAFLQRIVNGGGRITREYGLGMKRIDLYLEWPLDEKLARKLSTCSSTEES